MGPTLGQQIKARRKAMGMTQAEIAERAGVSRATLIAVEQGSITQTDTLRKVGKLLGLRLILKMDDAGHNTPWDKPWDRPGVKPARRGQRFPNIYEITAANAGLLP